MQRPRRSTLAEWTEGSRIRQFLGGVEETGGCLAGNHGQIKTWTCEAGTCSGPEQRWGSRLSNDPTQAHHSSSNPAITSPSAPPTTPAAAQENLPKTILSFEGSSVIHSATATEILNWSENLRAGFGVIHLSLQANDNDGTFNGVAIRAKSFETRTTKLGIFAENEDPQQRLFKTHRPTTIILYKDGNVFRKLCAGTNDGRLWSSHLPKDSEMQAKIEEGMKGWNDLPQSVDSLHWRGDQRFSLIRVPYKEFNRVSWIPPLTEGEFTSRMEKEITDGMRPLAVQYLNDHGGQTKLYCSMANNAPDRKWCVTIGITADELRTIMENVEQLQGRPFSIASIRESGQIRFTVAWENVSPRKCKPSGGSLEIQRALRTGRREFSDSLSPGVLATPVNRKMLRLHLLLLRPDSIRSGGPPNCRSPSTSRTLSA